MAKVPNTVENCGNYYYLSRVHEHYRRQTDGRQHIANVKNLPLIPKSSPWEQAEKT